MNYGKAKKKPVVIEFYRYRGAKSFIDDFRSRQVPDWLFRACLEKKVYYNGRRQRCFCQTLEGEHLITPDDVLIRGVAGEIYPCKPGVFEQTYEVVGSE